MTERKSASTAYDLSASTPLSTLRLPRTLNDRSILPIASTTDTPANNDSNIPNSLSNYSDVSDMKTRNILLNSDGKPFVQLEWDDSDEDSSSDTE